MKNIKDIEEKIHGLPPSLLEEVDDFIDFIIKKNKTRKKIKPKMGWNIK